MGTATDVDGLRRFDDQVHGVSRDGREALDSKGPTLAGVRDKIAKAVEANGSIETPVQVHDEMAITFHDASLVWLRKSFDLLIVPGHQGPQWLYKLANRVNPQRFASIDGAIVCSDWDPIRDGRAYYPKMIERLTAIGLPMVDSVYQSTLYKEHLIAMSHYGFSGDEAVNERGTPIVLGSPDECPIVFGNKKPRLGDAQFRAVALLVDARGRPMTLGELEDPRNGVPSARARLRELRESDPDWKRAIIMPGRAGRGGYRIATTPRSE